MQQIGNNEYNKHDKYKNHYKPNDLYWGIGIENELYLEFDKRHNISNKDFTTNHKKERYSVDYYSNYKKEYLEESFKKYDEIELIDIPVLMNSHSFNKTDINNNSKTLYTKDSKPNPDFIGQTLLELLTSKNEYFKHSINNKWVFDGDTIEFMSINFYNNKLLNIIKELEANKKEFIEELQYSFEALNIYSDYGKIHFMKDNYPFSMYMTNLNNVAMFNNGTLHYNLTLPTQLDENSLILNKEKFINDHSKAIKIIQWMEPFIIGVYGSKDPLTENASQRCAISRYVSIGTFDTDKMETGKILTKPIKDVKCYDCDSWWFNQFYKDNAYNKLDEIGLDINFNKHFNHGIEIRFLDHLNDNSNIYESFEFIIYLMDIILEDDHINNFGNPIINKIWNDLVLNMIKYGGDYVLTDEERTLYQSIFKFEFNKRTIRDIYYEIYWNLTKRYNKLFRIMKTDEVKTLYVLIPDGKFSYLTLDAKDTDGTAEYNITNKDIQKEYISTYNCLLDDSKNNYISDKKNKCCIIS